MTQRRGCTVTMCALLAVLCAAQVAHAQQTAGDLGMDLRLPFDLSVRHRVVQTYCPNDVTWTGGDCYSHHSRPEVVDGLFNDNYAIDFSGPAGTPILAVLDGTVITSGWSTYGYGYHIQLEHSNGCISHYGHLQSGSRAAVGANVSRGDQIGLEGSTGYSTGPHVHFALHCPVAGQSGVYEPVIPEPISGYKDFLTIDFDLSDSSKWVAIGGNDGITRFPVGTLVKTVGQPEIYLVCEEGTLCQIADWQAFTSRRLWNGGGDDMSRVVEVTWDVLSCHEQGPDIDTHPEMRLTDCGSDRYVIFRDSFFGIRRRIPFASTSDRYLPLIRSWGLTNSNLGSYNSADCVDTYLGPDLELRIGTVIEESSDNDFWIVTADSYHADDVVPIGQPRLVRLPREETADDRTVQLAYEMYRAYENVIMVPDGSAEALAGVADSGEEFSYAFGTQCITDGTGGNQGGGGDIPQTGCVEGDRRCDDTSSYAYCIMDWQTGVTYWSQSWPCGDATWECVSEDGQCTRVSEPPSVTPPPNTIECEDGGNTFTVRITGPIQDGLWGPVTGQDVYLQYGSNADGWTSYTSGKPMVAWTGDWNEPDEPATYQITLDDSVQSMNFFLYSPDTGEQEWLNLEWDIWDVTGDCWLEGTTIRHGDGAPPPPASTATGNINCTVMDSETMVVDFSGPILDLLVGGSVTTPTEIQYGSDYDGWTVPYSQGKASTPWNGTDTHSIVMSPNVYDFNFYLTDGSGGGRWFDLVDADSDGDLWNITGDCWSNSGVIAHSAPPAGSGPPHTIDCQVDGAEMVVSVVGPVQTGIFGTAPTEVSYLEYGSDTDGWGAYMAGKPLVTWNETAGTHVLTLDSGVQNMNFFLYEPATGQVNWFDLNLWDVTGDCWRDGGGLRH